MAYTSSDLDINTCKVYPGKSVGGVAFRRYQVSISFGTVEVRPNITTTCQLKLETSDKNYSEI